MAPVFQNIIVSRNICSNAGHVRGSTNLLCSTGWPPARAMTTRLTLAIQEHFEQLSQSERKLATLLLQRADDLLTYSATELAGMAGVSKATAARLFRSLGYADFNEVRLQAREERNLAPPFHSAEGVHASPAQGHSIAAHLQAVAWDTAQAFPAKEGRGSL